ncbi:MAG: FkbM family methyltransferase [Pseudomonadota bacterium]
MASHLSTYLRRFGFRRGFGMYAHTKWSRGPIDVQVPGLTHPLRMRAGTSDRGCFNQIFVNGEYDTPYPGKPRLIIDAGANVGYATVRFASLYPEAKIIAIEPEQANYEMLKTNIAPYPGVRTLMSGVWPCTAPLTIDNPHDRPWAFRVRAAHPGEASFPAVSIQDLLAQSGETTLDILKLDVEGTEHDLFSDPGCHEWISRTNMIFVETHDHQRPGCSRVLEAALAQHHFERSQVGENAIYLRTALLA